MSDTRANKRFRSQEWFDNPNNPGMTALYVERYQNSTFTREEIQGGRPRAWAFFFSLIFLCFSRAFLYFSMSRWLWPS